MNCLRHCVLEEFHNQHNKEANYGNTGYSDEKTATNCLYELSFQKSAAIRVTEGSDRSGPNFIELLSKTKTNCLTLSFFLDKEKNYQSNFHLFYIAC